MYKQCMEPLSQYHRPKTKETKNQISSDRPISLLSTLGKLFKKLILKHITPIIQ